MQKLSDDKVNEIEQTVRDDFEDILKTDEYDVFKYIDRIHIYGLYGGKVERFRFMPGERELIRKMVKYVNSLKVDAIDGEAEEIRLEQTFRIEHFDLPPGIKISRKDLCRSPIGYLFGKKTHIIPKTIVGKTDEQSAKEDLLLKCNKRLESFDSTMNMEQITIINDGKRIFANASCPLCDGNANPIAIQFDVPRNSNKGYWNLSNYGKHLTLHSKRENNEKVQEESKTSLEETNEPVLKDGPNSSIVISSLNGTMNSTSIEPQDQDSYTTTIYKTLSNLNLALTAAIKSKNESVAEMMFLLNEKTRSVDIIQIDGCGSCLFAASAHQIFLHKVNSNQHKASTKKLRRDVVKHITDNFEQFKDVIISRLKHEGEKDFNLKGKDWDEKSRHFVKSVLSKPSCWGSTESLMAISNLYNLNVLIFNENDVCWFPFEFVDEFKTIALAYRVSKIEANERNHYDSISEIGQPILFDCSVLLAKNEMKRIEFKKSKDEVVEIDESMHEAEG